MTIDFRDAHKAVRRGAKSATRALDIAHDASRRGVRQARSYADEAIDLGNEMADTTTGMARSAHDWMEAKPHLAALAALAAGVLIGAMFSPRR